MTNTVKLLSDDEVAEIETRANGATPLPDDGSTVRTIYDHGGGRMYVQRNAERDLILDSHNRGDSEFYFHAYEDIPALCATVRVLRQQVDEWESHRRGFIELFETAEARVKDLESENTALREQLAQIQGERNWFKAQCENLQESVRTEAGAAINLQSQLAQVTAERDRAREDLRILTKGRIIQS